MSSFGKLFRSIATYASANILNSAIPFFLLPVLTRVLDPVEYGAVAMLTTLISVLGAFTGLSMHGAVSVRYFSSDTDHSRFIGACLSVLSVSTLGMLLIVWALSGVLTGRVGLSIHWLIVAVLISAAQTVINVRLVMWQVKGEVLRYGVFQVAQTLLNLGLSLCLILVVGLGWEGRGYGIAIAVFLFGGLALYGLNRAGYVSLSFSLDYVRSVLRFGVPLIPHSLGGMLLSISDRFIIMSLLGPAATGSYAVGAQVGMVIGILADAFVKAFGPHLYGELKEADDLARAKVARQCIVVFFLFLIGAITYMLLLPSVYKFLLGEAYGDSLLVAQLVGFGNAFMGMYYVVAGFVFFAERTGLLARLTMSVGLLNVMLSYFLVGHIGILGAALSYMATQLLFFLGAWYLANRVYSLPWFSCFRKKVRA